jgi:hypothetical protein
MQRTRSVSNLLAGFGIAGAGAVLLANLSVGGIAVWKIVLGVVGVMIFRLGRRPGEATDQASARRPPAR